jgi:hypothetical protein
MQLLNRLVVVLFFGLFGGAVLLMCYPSYQHERLCFTIAGPGNDLTGCWILILFTLFGIALCAFSIYCLFPLKPIAPKFTLAPSASPWVGVLTFAVAVAFILLILISALLGAIHST